MAKGSAAKNRKPKAQIGQVFSNRPKPIIISPASAREALMIPVKFPLMPRTPRISPDTSMPLAQMVSTTPSVFASAKDSIIGSARIWNIPMNSVMAEDTSTSSSTPLRARNICQPSRCRCSCAPRRR